MHARGFSTPSSFRQWSPVALVAAALLMLSAAAAPAAEVTPAQTGSPGDPVAAQPAMSATSEPLLLASLYDDDRPPDSTADVEDYSGYNGSYIFGLTRGVARSTIVGPLKPPLFIFTIPLDLALLPFAVIGGFF